MANVILHIDLNQFFVRCEELRNPSLEGKPVIIGHEGRGGIVSTCSYKAREYGVRSGMPTFKAKILCPNAIIIGVDFKYYSKKSREFIDFVLRHTKLVEQMSVDECFADMTEVLKQQKHPVQYIKDFQTNLFKETGLRCSIGVANTKFLAKMASDMKKPNGLTILNKDNFREKLYPLDIGDCFGIGKKTAPKLKEQGINTIGDLAKILNSDNEIAKKKFGKMAITLSEWLNGRGDDKVSTEKFDPKSIGHSTTLTHNTLSIEELTEEINWICEDIEKQAKAENKVGNTVQLVLKDFEFKVINRSKKLDKFTNSASTMKKVAVSLLEKNIGDKEIRLIGVTLQNLKDNQDTNDEISLFDNYEDIEKKYATDILIQKLNRKMNGEIFSKASDKIGNKK